VIARARDLQRKIEAGTGLDERSAKARRAVEDFDKETEDLIKQRRVGHFQLMQTANGLNQLYLAGQQAKHELVELMRRHPLLLGDVSAVT
jgi:hypothetical protein